MSSFVLRDETADRFAALEHKPRHHALAFTLWSFVGQRSARLGRDGQAIGYVDLVAATPGWTKRLRIEVAELLVDIGLWVGAGDGWAFADWTGIGQWPAAKVAEAKEQHAARQQRYRERHSPVRDEKSGVHRIPVAKTPSKSKQIEHDFSLTPPENTQESGKVTRPSPSLSSSDLSSRDQVTQPAAATPAVICIEQERAKRAGGKEGAAPPKPKPRRTRKRVPLDDARDAVLEVFNAQYAPRHNGVRSSLTHGLLTTLARCYQHEDGTFMREQFAAAVRGFLADPLWTRLGRGYGLEVFVFNHGKYVGAASSSPAATTPRNPRNYA
jgi:hypothetical protein